MVKNETIIKIYEELHNNFKDYIDYKKLALNTNLDKRTCKKWVSQLQDLKLFNKPFCECCDENSQDN